MYGDFIVWQEGELLMKRIPIDGEFLSFLGKATKNLFHLWPSSRSSWKVELELPEYVQR